MAVTESGRCIEAASDREMAAPGRSLADLRAALAEGMGGWQDSVGDPQSLHDALMAVIEARSGGAEIVAGAYGDGLAVYDRDMGTARRRYARPFLMTSKTHLYSGVVAQRRRGRR